MKTYRKYPLVLKLISYLLISLYVISTNISIAHSETAITSKDWPMHFENAQHLISERDINLPLKLTWVVNGKNLIKTKLLNDKLYSLHLKKGLLGFVTSRRDLYLVIMDAKTGKELERMKVSSEDRIHFTDLLVSDKSVYATTTAVYDDKKVISKLYAINLTTKEVKQYFDYEWKHEYKSSDTWLTMEGNNLLLTLMNKENGDKLFLFDTNTGKLLWQNKGASKGYLHYSVPVMNRTTVYLTAYVRNLEGPGFTKCAALDIKNGNNIWEVTIEGEAFASSPVLFKDTIFTVTLKGRKSNVYAIANTDGSILWREESENNFSGAPAIENDTLYVFGRPHTVAFNLANGGKLKEYITSDRITKSVYLAKDTFFLKAPHSIEFYNKDTGALIATYAPVLNGGFYDQIYDVIASDKMIYALLYNGDIYTYSSS